MSISLQVVSISLQVVSIQSAGGEYQSAGGPEGAKNGTLAIMCGGEQATFDAATPILEAMGQYVVRLGGPGSGSGAKVLLLAWQQPDMVRWLQLVNQLLTAANANSACEALALARALGMDSSQISNLLELLGKAWGESGLAVRAVSASYSSVPLLHDTEGSSGSTSRYVNLRRTCLPRFSTL